MLSGLRPWRLFLLLAMVVAVVAATPLRTTGLVAPSNPANSLSLSAWDRPPLASPVAITLTATNDNLNLPAGQDYNITCAPGTTFTSGPVIFGGHNIDFHDCDVNLGSNASGGASFKNQTGTMYVNNVHLHGSDLLEGIDLQEPNPGATVVLRDVLVDELHGSQQTNHADVIQTWCGPARLLVDGLTANSDYQGFFLLPNQNGGCAGAIEDTYDFRHVNMTVAGGYSQWLGWVGAAANAAIDLNTQDVYVAGPGEPRANPGNQWRDVSQGSPSGGDYVTSASTGATGVDEPAGANGANGAGVNPPAYVGEQQ